MTILSVDEALATEQGKPVRVQGMLVVTETRAVLASVLLESYPPQAGGSTLGLEGLVLDGLVGLSSTAAQPDLAPVTWSDYPVVLEGVVEDGTLTVTGAPPAFEAATPEVRVRFTMPVEPEQAGGMVWWVFDVTNLTEAPLDLTFGSGQRGEVILSSGGVERYRWSDEKVFTQAVEVQTAEPGASVPVVLNDSVQLPPGEYEVSATVTASLGPEGAPAPLPEIKTTLTVR